MKNIANQKQAGNKLEFTDHQGDETSGNNLSNTSGLGKSLAANYFDHFNGLAKCQRGKEKKKFSFGTKLYLSFIFYICDEIFNITDQAYPQCTYMYAYMYICIYKCIYVCMHMHVYEYTLF